MLDYLQKALAAIMAAIVALSGGAAAPSQGLTVSQGETVTPTAVSTATPVAKIKVEFEGVISSIGSSSWVVGGRTVYVDVGTKFEGRKAEVGAVAEVEALLRADSTLLALSIDVEGPKETKTPEAGIKVEFEGVISSMNGSSWVVGGRTVYVDAGTKFEGRKAEVGAVAEVEALLRADGTLLALSIEVEGPKETKTPEAKEAHEEEKETEEPKHAETPEIKKAEPTKSPEKHETPEPGEAPEKDDD
ncbi:MAG: hypothetical protein HY871_04865 [Chloroflexi bacterium]|nr:hypothetical protein [Chloroflexota bacterium]